MTLPDFSLKGKVAIVTGGRRGIGRAIALGFAEAGADLAICDIVTDDGKLDSAAAEIRKFGRRALAMQTDVSRKSDVDKFVSKVVDEFGHIDILVNNAAVIVRCPLVEHSESDWDVVMNTNLKGYFLMGQAVARKMIEQKGGNMINITSSEAIRAVPGAIAYTVSNAARDMFTRVMALELAIYNIRVNAIIPHMVKTDLAKDRWKDPERVKPFLAEVPMGRNAGTGELIGAALFLASDASSWVTGSSITTDGGYLAGDTLHPRSPVRGDRSQWQRTGLTY